jgi:hypothetical protein
MGINTSVRMLKRKWASINFLFMQVLKQTWRFRRKLECYKTKIYSIFEKLQNGKDGVNDIKAFFMIQYECHQNWGP